MFNFFQFYDDAFFRMLLFFFTLAYSRGRVFFRCCVSCVLCSYLAAEQNSPQGTIKLKVNVSDSSCVDS